MEVVLVGDRLRPKAERKTTALGRALWTRCRLDRTPAGASIFLALHLHQNDVDFDVDHLGGLGLTGHGLEPATAAGAGAVGLIQLEKPRLAPELGLRRRTVASLRRGRLVRRFFHFARVDSSLGLRAFAETLQELKDFLKAPPATPQLIDLVASDLQDTQDPFELRFLKKRGLTKSLDVALASKIHRDN